MQIVPVMNSQVFPRQLLTGLFITGTDTSVGKTYLAAQIVRQLVEEGCCAGAYKPVCSGAKQSISGKLVWEDIEELYLATDAAYSRQLICPQAFEAPLAPPVAARKENRKVDERLLVQGLKNWEGQADALVVEGVGGWKCPISESLTVADLAVEFGFPVLLIARVRLGMINHTLLTIESIKSSGLNLVGLVLNDMTGECDLDIADNLAEIERFASIPYLGSIKFCANLQWNRPPRFQCSQLLGHMTTR